jgi:hypothetical protein
VPCAATCRGTQPSGAHSCTCHPLYLSGTEAASSACSLTSQIPASRVSIGEQVPLYALRSPVGIGAIVFVSNQQPKWELQQKPAYLDTYLPCGTAREQRWEARWA